MEAEKIRTLHTDYLPQKPLYGEAKEPSAWGLSPEPFQLKATFVQGELQRLGSVLWRFEWACERIYRDSLSGQAPVWIASILNQGKPEALIKYATMKRFRSRMPLVIRPDLLMTESGIRLTEVDAVPGGMGFTSAMNQAYKQSGFPVLEAPEGMPEAFLAMLKAAVPDKENPVIGVVLSDESADYRQEMTWLAEQIQAVYPDFYVIHPRELALVREKLMFDSGDGEKALDLIYRFFELFDLPNIPKMDLLQYAVKRGWVACTPPFKPHLEEKSWLTLIHHPILKPLWKKYLGAEDWEWLRGRIPKGWLMDPAYVPSMGVIPDLSLRGQTVQSFESLKGLTQKERQLVIKPSGFSPLAWGSRGVTIGHDVSGDVWDKTVESALSSFDQTPYILQEYHKPMAHPLKQLDLETGAIRSFQGRTRLCPYYFITPDPEHPAEPERAKIELAGVLATSCPADKKIIHGMKDAIMSPCMIGSELKS